MGEGEWAWEQVGPVAMLECGVWGSGPPHAPVPQTLQALPIVPKAGEVGVRLYGVPGKVLWSSRTGVLSAHPAQVEHGVAGGILGTEHLCLWKQRLLTHTPSQPATPQP